MKELTDEIRKEIESQILFEKLTNRTLKGCEVEAYSLVYWTRRRAKECVGNFPIHVVILDEYIYPDRHDYFGNTKGTKGITFVKLKRITFRVVKYS